MRETNDFIGNYRILTKLSSKVAGELYLVEHTFHASATSFLLLWSGIELSRNEDRAAFLQRSSGSTLHQNSLHIPILDAGIDNLHPYIITAHSTQAEEIIRERLGSLGQALQTASVSRPDDPSTRTAAFLRLFTDMTAPVEDSSHAPTTPLSQQEPAASPPPDAITDKRAPASPPPDAPTVKRPFTSSPPVVKTRRQKVVASYQRLKLWQRLVLALLVLALVGWGFFALYTHVPALGATVTITPVTRTLNGDYQISVGTGSPSTNTIQGRKISLTSEQKSQTVAATGKGHHDAIQAKGDLVVSQIHLDNPARNKVGPSTLTGASGIAITTDGDVTVSEGGTVTQHAHAEKAGSSGNIGAYDINFPVEITDVLTNAHIGTAYAANPNGFSGGAEASDFLFVQQSDIVNVENNFSTQLTSNTTAKVKQQVKSDEHMAGDIQCTPKSSSNHKANDQSNDVTVNFSTTCAVLVYKDQDLQQAAVTTYKADGPARFGEGYDLVGNMQIGSPTLSNATVDSAQFTFPINGIWTLQWTPQRQKELLSAIAGKPQDDAMQILGGREGVKDVSISGNWFPGSALPSNPDDIKFVATKVNGLP
ncbi:MAG: hypothetical protein H0U76_29985 [Ktedonobacteraceae bacterium]|nr:hypothetical protein [Ktedonobacteraceae bacterium]